MHKVEFTRVALQPDKLLVGMAAKMSVASDATPSLWQRFMPRRGLDTGEKVMINKQNTKQ